MISREDFIFTIGYDGKAAVVDAGARNAYGKRGTLELAERGFFRAAFSSALYSGSAQEQESFVEYYNRKAGASFGKFDELRKVFGVNLEDVKKVIALK